MQPLPSPAVPPDSPGAVLDETTAADVAAAGEDAAAGESTSIEESVADQEPAADEVEEEEPVGWPSRSNSLTKALPMRT
jgi:hypothetical protein